MTTALPPLTEQRAEHLLGTGFDAVLTSGGITVRLTAPRSPNMNAHAERVLQSIQEECTDHFWFFGERSLFGALAEYFDWYHHHRPELRRLNVGGCAPIEADAFSPAAGHPHLQALSVPGCSSTGDQAFTFASTIRSLWSLDLPDARPTGVGDPDWRAWHS